MGWGELGEKRLGGFWGLGGLWQGQRWLTAVANPLLTASCDGASQPHTEKVI